MATTVYNTQPFMLVLLGAVVFRERITLRTILWLSVAFFRPGAGCARGARGVGQAR